MALGKLLLWLPFWPYAKGIVTLLLVTPYFNGASYIYRHFIRPYASMNLEANDCLLISETKDCLAYEQDSFLDGAGRHITVREEKELVKPVIYQDEHRATYGCSTVSPLTWSESPKKFQKEWSCALCLVSTTSQKCLAYHLQGKKHKAMEEELRKEEAVANRATNLLDSFNHITWVNLERLGCLLTPVARPIQWCTWKKPELGWTKLNTDGSIDRDNAGFGGLFRDCKGDPICAYVSKAPRHDIFLVELWAIWRGLVLALGIGIRVLWVESDSLSVVKTINRKQPYGPKAHSCLKHIWDILKKFEKYKVTHSWRETNRAADHLAKMDLLGSDIVLWPKDFPNSLYKIIKDDAQGKSYRRG